jgi:glycosyltransferase involved in cell wall biosynthesis
MLLLTNSPPCVPANWTASTGERGQSRVLTGFSDFVRQLSASDAIIVNCDPSLTLKLAALFTAFPFMRRPLIAVDIVLRQPAPEVSGRMAGRLKRFLFRRVDHFIHHFKDLHLYQHFFGIGPERSSFVPFKPNIRYQHAVPPDSEGEYVLCFGRSLRDYDTFLDAMERIPYPGAVPKPDFSTLRQHGSRFTRSMDRLPKNVRMLEDDGSSHALVRILAKARIVVLPILRTSLLAGISTYLNAMYMGKCVILSEGPGCSDVLTGQQCLFVVPEDPEALARRITEAWENDQLRIETAGRGFQYAVSLGGAPQLQQRVLDKAIAFLRSPSAG